MNRSRSLFLSISLAVLLPVASGVLWSAVNTEQEDDGEDSLYKYLAIFSEAFGLVRNNYVDPADPDALLGGALEGISDALDPFSALVPAAYVSEFEQLEKRARERSGIVLVKEQGIAYVVAVEAGSPGAAAGVERGDVVAEVASEETRGAPLWQLYRHLAGAPGEQLKLRIVRSGEAIDKTVALGAFTPLPPRLESVKGIAILHLARIGSGEAERVRPLLEELARRRATKLLVDLRGLGGGDPEQAYAIGAMFASGDLGRLVERGAPRRTFRSETAPLFRGEVAVLLDNGTFGAGEILAAILHSGASAKLVGVKSFGWAGVRSFVELSGGAGLHLTTAFYTGPDGVPIATGLAPDVLVDDLGRRFGDGDRSLDDLILERGIELLAGESLVERQAA